MVTHRRYPSDNNYPGHDEYPQRAVYAVGDFTGDAMQGRGIAVARTSASLYGTAADVPLRSLSKVFLAAFAERVSFDGDIWAQRRGFASQVFGASAGKDVTKGVGGGFVCDDAFSRGIVAMWGALADVAAVCARSRVLNTSRRYDGAVNIIDVAARGLTASRTAAASTFVLTDSISQRLNIVRALADAVAATTGGNVYVIVEKEYTTAIDVDQP